jgi:hypothetical protein
MLSLQLNDPSVVSVYCGLLCGLTDKTDYEKLLASKTLVCEPYDDAEFYKKPFKLIFEYNFDEHCSDKEKSKIVRSLTFTLWEYFSELEIIDEETRTVNEGIIVAFNNATDFNKFLTAVNIQIKNVVCRPYRRYDTSF